jgi:hypothetical protein
MDLEVPMKITRKLMHLTLACSFFLGSLLASRRTLKVTPQNVGYELSEEELAGEMLAALRSGFLAQPAPSIDPDEFEEIYACFLS